MTTVLALINAIREAKIDDVERCLVDIEEGVNGLSSDDMETDDPEEVELRKLLQEYTPLMFAITCSSRDKSNVNLKRIVQLMINHPLTKINLHTHRKCTAIFCAASENVELMNALLIKAKRQAEAAGLDSVKAVEDLVNTAADISEEDEADEEEVEPTTPLTVAIEEGNVAVVELLLTAGANPLKDNSSIHPLANAIQSWKRVMEYGNEFVGMYVPVGSLAQEQLNIAKRNAIKYLAIIDALRRKMTPETVLVIAAVMADIRLFNLVLAENPDVTIDGARAAIKTRLPMLEGKENLKRPMYLRMLKIIGAGTAATAKDSVTSAETGSHASSSVAGRYSFLAAPDSKKYSAEEPGIGVGASAGAGQAKILVSAPR